MERSSTDSPKHSEMGTRAASYFHQPPHDDNCCQAVCRAAAVFSDSELDSFSAWGGGRAEKGTCGALYGAYLIEAKRHGRSLPDIEGADKQVCERLRESFEEKCGSFDCASIKGQIPCAEYVAIACEQVHGK